MALATEKLYYRRNDVTYSINTYTALSDVGTEAVKLQINGAERFVGVGDVGDSRQSHLRVMKDGTIKSVLLTNILYNPAWTIFGRQVAPSYGEASSSYTVTTDYWKVYSSSSLYNLRLDAVLATSPSTTYTRGRIDIDGVTYYVPATTTNVEGRFTRYFRLSSGTHTIVLYGIYYDVGENGQNTYYTEGYVVS